MLNLLIVGFVWVVWVWTHPARKVVPKHVERSVWAELSADEDTDLVDEDGNLTRRAGVSLRIAKEVKLRFGGTPRLTEANRMLAARYIDEALVEHGVTRKLDRARMLYRIRALVFTRLAEEMEEDQWLNSAASQRTHDSGTGWASFDEDPDWLAWVPPPLRWLVRRFIARPLRRRHVSSA